MGRRSRLTQQSDIARSFGGRSGFVSEELGRGGAEPEQMSRLERSAACCCGATRPTLRGVRRRDRVGVNRLLPSAELLVAVAIVAVFVGGFAGFIALLALTR